MSFVGQRARGSRENAFDVTLLLDKNRRVLFKGSILLDSFWWIWLLVGPSGTRKPESLMDEWSGSVLDELEREFRLS